MTEWDQKYRGLPLGHDDGEGVGVYEVLEDLQVLGARPNQAVDLGELGTDSSHHLYQ